MKRKQILILLVTFIWLLSCGSNDNASKETMEQKETSNEVEKTSSSENKEGDGIVGEWEMEGSVLDTNDNLQIDEEERKNLKPASFKDYMKLNSDGSGLFTVGKMEGRYEVTDEGGKKSFNWFDKANGRHRIGTIIKIAKDELHIKEPGGSGMFVWKRI